MTVDIQSPKVFRANSSGEIRREERSSRLHKYKTQKSSQLITIIDGRNEGDGMSTRVCETHKTLEPRTRGRRNPRITSVRGDPEFWKDPTTVRTHTRTGKVNVVLKEIESPDITLYFYHVGNLVKMKGKV